MKSLLFLWKEVYADACTWCCTGASFQWQQKIGTNIVHDFRYIERRVNDEGVSFLTITLPSFGKALEKCLEKGMVTRQDFPKFRKEPGKSALPLFLGGLLELIFDRASGRLLDDPSIEAIQSIRQLTLMYKKIALPCTPERERRAIDKFVECERDVKEWDVSSFPHDDEVKKMFLLLYADVLSVLDKRIWEGTLVPRHGPGSTAERLLGNAKWAQSEWTDRLERIFPFGDNVLPNWRYSYIYRDVDFLEPGKERPVRVVLVPKTLETPRVIAIEPTCMQYMQQAVASSLVPLLETSVWGMLGFTDQSVSRDLAKTASSNKQLATVDLKEASDRVSNELVRHLFSSWPHVNEALDATRSRSALLPDGRKLRLAKFASMGSALCFPVEAMVFLAVAFVGIQRSLNRRLTRKDVKRLSRKVRVYGDDIIVPTEHVQSVVQSLESYGLKVNWNKTFWNGNFRESCGGEYYDGVDVGYVHLNQVLPPNRQDAKGVLGLIAFRNLLYKRGYWRGAAFCDNWLACLNLPFPIVADESPLSGRASFLPWQEERIHPDHHKPLVRGIMASTQTPASKVDDCFALTKCFVLPFQEDSRHLERSGRPDTVGIKIRWGTPY